MILNAVSGTWCFTIQVWPSNCWMVTAAPGGHSGGITNRRRWSKTDVFILWEFPTNPALSQPFFRQSVPVFHLRQANLGF